MVWAQIESVAIDLETFSRHAGRTTVTTDDVLLVCRRNEALQGIIRDFVDRGKAEAATKASGRKRAGGRGAVGNGKGKGTAKGKGRPKD
jgi:centromere protein S